MICAVLALNYSGLLNVSGDKIFSIYELGLEIAAFKKKDKGMITSVSSDEFRQLLLGH